MMKKLLIAAVAALISTAALGQQIDSGAVMGNSRATAGPPRGETVTAILDRAFSAVNGTVLCRAAGAWNDCSALTLGIAGSTIGTLSLAGNTSGAAMITPQAAAGTPVLTLPTATGTFAVGATSPIVLNAGTGMLTCPTCFTTTAAAALTKTDDTNVTLTLGGSPATALVNAASLTLGWTGQLAMTRGGTGASLTASNGGIVWTDANSMEVLAGTATARQMLQSGATATPAWSTATWPATTTVSRILYSSSNNVVGEITTANRGVVNTDGSGVPSVTATPTLGVNGGTGGQITLNGSTSGSAVVKVAAAAGTTNFQLPVGNGSSGNVLQTDGSGNTSWAASAGSGDVTAAANFGTDNVAIRSDGTGKGVQSTGVGIDDSNNVTGVNSIAGSVIATAAQQETATSAINVVTPSVQQRHPSSTKAWARCDAAGGTSLAYNASCSRTGVGEYLMTFTTAFSNTSFPCLCTLQSTNHTCATSPASTTTATVSVRNLTPAAADSIFSVACFGDQ